MNHITHSSLRGATLLAGLALALSCLPAHGADKATSTDAFPNFDSYIKISGQAASVTGDAAAFARRLQRPSNGAYGVEALHVNKEVDKETSMEFDGRALTGSEDYLGQLKLTKNEVGNVDLGYKRFRTFYDGIGGFFPLNGVFKELGKPELHTDRAKFWAGLTLARPNAPVFTLNYSNELRNGRKDSAIWGDTDNTGWPVYSLSSLNVVSSDRKIIPSTIDLSERQEVWSGTMKHTIGKTELELEVVSNHSTLLDTRSISRYPGELKPYPAIASTPVTLVPWTLASNAVAGPDTIGNKANTMSYLGKFETELSETLALYGALSYIDTSADVTGYRMMYQQMNTKVGAVNVIGGFAANGRPPYSYTSAGKITDKVTTANLGLRFKPNADTYVSVAVKNEKEEINGSSPANYVSTLIVQATGATTVLPLAAPNTGSSSLKPWVPELEARYTGIKDLALYGVFDYRSEKGSEAVSGTNLTPVGSTVTGAIAASNANVDLKHSNYKAGFNWTPSELVELRGEVFYKDHKNNFADIGSATGGFVLGYQFTGTKLTGILKVNPQLKFTTRYLGQKGKMNTIVDSGTSMDSNDTTTNSLGETIDWNPNNNVYFQANVNVVFATIKTIYPRAGGLANDVLHNADNNYINGSLVSGFAVEKDTDAQLAVTFYNADNYKVMYSTVPYGASAKEYTVSLGLKHKFSNSLVGNLKVGYFDCKNDTTGGFTNFRGPLAYVTMEHAL